MELFKVERGSPPTKDPIGEMVGALTDPIIVFPGGGWEETIPEKLKADLPVHRLIHIHKCLKGKADWEEATDLEALIYMYPASLTFPFDHDWTEIYLYLGTRHFGDKCPEDIKRESLRDDQMQDLRDLKRWIYRKRVEARKARAKAEKTEKAQERETHAAKYEQLSFV